MRQYLLMSSRGRREDFPPGTVVVKRQGPERDGPQLVIGAVPLHLQREVGQKGEDFKPGQSLGPERLGFTWLVTVSSVLWEKASLIPSKCRAVGSPFLKKEWLPFNIHTVLPILISA